LSANGSACAKGTSTSKATPNHIEARDFYKTGVWNSFTIIFNFSRLKGENSNEFQNY
jgi:hypothetical protein